MSNHKCQPGAAKPPSPPQGAWKAPAQGALEAILNQVRFDSAGLVAAMAQAEDGTLLMLAWMNRQALAETLSTGRVCYYSRSRQKLWRKGESSGQHQSLLDARLDCDGDAILLTVRQHGGQEGTGGVACHTGRRSCFHQRITPQGLHPSESPLITPGELYGTVGGAAAAP
ncbi:phosphoribosyl-AMP cyclohydrolase [Formicincola oecophyllae]|uniref:Phosphoribosyl-AMP cyclohydrolase n=1 Tax=Formicincola oecophyllae TaxID=2558361 RepID=A0A4Y6U6B7_9PROT|nr:phosphoribosyl-AMP cyclohydrolase [Formicincola oecophyllae]QDH12893.1 phosphoribosyl-AMP cyclohydrolase [Formicincola oecophyllae]